MSKEIGISKYRPNLPACVPIEEASITEEQTNQEGYVEVDVERPPIEVESVSVEVESTPIDAESASIDLESTPIDLNSAEVESSSIEVPDR